MTSEDPMPRPQPDPPALPAWQGTQLLRRIAGGDESALESLHHALGDRLFSMALHWLRDEGRAKEALQDTLLRIWKRAGSYDAARSNPFTWCAMILRGICLDSLRKQSRAPRLIDDLSAGAGFLPLHPVHDGVNDLFFHDTVRRVREALAMLGDDERETLEAALFDPAPVRELAERWQQPLAAAKTRIHRAMLKIRQLLHEP